MQQLPNHPDNLVSCSINARHDTYPDWTGSRFPQRRDTRNSFTESVTETVCWESVSKDFNESKKPIQSESSTEDPACKFAPLNS